MNKLKRTTIVVTVAAMWMTGAAAEERVFGAIQSMDQSKRATETAAIGTAELARARAAGEMPAAEETTSRIREYTTVRPAASATAAPRSQVTEDSKPAVVNAASSTKALANSPIMSDAARAAEVMKYEAEKKRRATEQVSARAIEPARVEDEARARPGENTRSSINWMANEQESTRPGAIGASEEAMTRLGLSDRR